MKKVLTLLVALCLLACSFTAFAEPTKVAVIYSATIDDKGWCQAMDTGIKNAIDMGYEIEYEPIETVAIADAESVIDRLVGEYDIILVHGAQFSNAVVSVAEQNPDQIFLLGTSDKIMGDNVFTYMPQSEEPGYLNGIAAAIASKSGKVGIVGSADSGDAYRYVRGFVLGYKSVLPDAEIPMAAWTGSFDDTVGVGDIADIMINSDCDVLTGASQQAVGALRKAAAANTLWTAQTMAQMNDFPEISICAADYEYSSVIIQVLDKVAEGVTGGICIPMNYSNNGFVFEFSADENLCTEEIKTAVNAALEALRAEADTVDYNSVVFE